MIKRMLLVGVCLFGLTTTTALAEEEYPPKDEDKEVSRPDKEVADKGGKGDAGDAEGEGEMAETGSDTAPLVMAAGGLILVGGTLVASSRRRSADTSRDPVAVG